MEDSGKVFGGVLRTGFLRTNLGGLDGLSLSSRFIWQADDDGFPILVDVLGVV